MSKCNYFSKVTWYYSWRMNLVMNGNKGLSLTFALSRLLWFCFESFKFIFFCVWEVWEKEWIFFVKWLHEYAHTFACTIQTKLTTCYQELHTLFYNSMLFKCWCWRNRVKRYNNLAKFWELKSLKNICFGNNIFIRF